MHTFNTEDNRKFWDGNKASYQGSLYAGLLIFLSRPYIGTTILDAGAGDGSLLKEINKNIPSATARGIDISPKNPEVEQGDLKNLPYDDGSFDTVFCSEVIEHLTPDTTDMVLKELNRVLQPFGSLILTTPFAEDLKKNLITCPGCGLSFHRWGHQQNFVEDDFALLAKKSNFEPLQIFPVKYSRIRRFKFFGRALLTSSWWTQQMRGAKGKKNLIMIARKI